MNRPRTAFVVLLLFTSLLSACSINTATPAPAPRAASSGLVSVHIESSPSAAEIWVDGEFVGSTNMSYALAPGKRMIELRRAGFETWKRELTVRADTPTRIRADLTPLPRS